jgi:hypothetical protein
MTISDLLQSFFKAHPDVTIGQFATVADVYTTTIVRGLAGEKLWDSSEERIRHAIDVYCNDDDSMSGKSSPASP